MTWFVRYAIAFGSIAWMCPGGPRDAAGAAPAQIEFNRDIRPLLSQNCFVCHGPDKNERQADLRLDTKEGLFSAVEDRTPVVPHKPDGSELLRRISSTDADERMPPADSGKKLAPREIELIRAWIEQGAPWQGHWAYLPVARPSLPLPSGGNGASSATSPIDLLLSPQLQALGLTPAPRTDKRTLIRRLHADLVGLPPSIEEVEAFVHDPAPDAYEKLVDRLLASPHFGERMAIFWLDLVRFADTIGYHSDNPRNIAPYRDTVIRAFNANQRFDQFTVEQLAGDLLPNPTPQQLVASGYHRLLMTTEEGGAQPKEYAAKYLADRVRNVAAVWLGATMGCAECHDHKFDPYTTRDFYSLAAFFADVREADVGRREPGMLLPTPDQAARLKELDDQRAALQAKLDTDTPELTAAQAEWERSVLAPADKAPEKAADQKPAPASAESPQTGQQPSPEKKVPPPPAPILALLAIQPEQRSAEQKGQLAAHYRSIAPLLDPVRAELAAVDKSKQELEAQIPRSLVVHRDEPRTVRVLPRGNWLDETGPVVQPAVPSFLAPPLEVTGRRANRLDLARWLTSPSHPLPARVFVNRIWKQFFGQGISRSLEDFGAQGEWPGNQALLDWLASEFIASGWDVKHLIRQIVLSDAYQRSSVPAQDHLRLDPQNRLFARQARFRLDAEWVRDQALAVSGLLVKKIGGESAKPYQPAGYWDFLNFPTRTWQADSGENQYRRGLYTFWQRTFPHPSLLAFDAPTREECTAERVRSNVPQQALVLLNDPTYIEAARAFAVRILKEGGDSAPGRIDWAFRSALGRPPSAEEKTLMTDLVEKHRQRYLDDRPAAERLLKVGLFSPSEPLDPADLAAWTSAARVVLNLHEFITRN